jgi:hypothetical protein
LKYVVLPNRCCLFRRKKRISFRLQTPLELKGHLFWGDDYVNAIGRFPLGILLFVFGWLPAWTAGGLMFLFAGEWLGLPFLLAGWVFAGGMALHSRWLELRRFEEHLREVEASLWPDRGRTGA